MIKVSDILIIILFIFSFILAICISYLKNKVRKQFSFKDKWLCHQTIITSQIGNTTTIATVIKCVTAKNKEEAIGKFVTYLDKQNIFKKIEPIQCFEFGQLSAIE